MPERKSLYPLSKEHIESYKTIIPNFKDMMYWTENTPQTQAQVNSRASTAKKLYKTLDTLKKKDNITPELYTALRKTSQFEKYLPNDTTTGGKQRISPTEAQQIVREDIENEDPAIAQRQEDIEHANKVLNNRLKALVRSPVTDNNRQFRSVVEHLNDMVDDRIITHAQMNKVINSIRHLIIAPTKQSVLAAPPALPNFGKGRQKKKGGNLDLMQAAKQGAIDGAVQVANPFSGHFLGNVKNLAIDGAKSGLVARITGRSDDQTNQLKGKIQNEADKISNVAPEIAKPTINLLSSGLQSGVDHVNNAISHGTNAVLDKGANIVKTLAGKKKKSNWLDFVADFRKKHPMSYPQALKEAAPLYKKAH